MGNLIQTYINNMNDGINTVTNATRKVYNNLKDADSENLLKPLEGKGHLVNTNIVTAPVEAAKDSYYTMRALRRGISGKANDHELGKLNDLGLKIGGLAIATYLMTKHTTPKKKIMEFVGFGTFLASMALWPKIAIQWPTRILHGFNFRKQYVDEQGRKKYVTQDPNYVPFDLYKGHNKNEDLSVIADRMRIAKDEKNRNEIVKEQMRKISVQDNTLWMLTAGVATPVATALACNLLEKPVGKVAEIISDKKVNNTAEKISQYLSNGNLELEKELIGKNLDINAEKNLENVIGKYKGHVVTDKEIKEISDALTTGLDTKTKKAAIEDLSNLLKQNKIVVSQSTAQSIVDNIVSKINLKYGEGYANTIIDNKRVVSEISQLINNNGDNVISVNKADELRKSINTTITNIIGENSTLKPARKKIINSIIAETSEQVLLNNKVSVLTDGIAEQISKAGTSLRKFRAFDKTISAATHFKVEKAEETIIANNWNEVTETLIKELKISPNELNEAKSSEELTAKLFTGKLEELVKDEEKYKSFVKKLSSKMEKLDLALDGKVQERAGNKLASKLDNLFGTDKFTKFDKSLDKSIFGRKSNNNVIDNLVDGIIKNCDKTSSELNSKGFFNLARRISGEEINGVFIGSIKQSKLDRIKQARIGSVENAYMRLLHTLDFFKRAEEYKTSGGIKGGFSGNPVMDEELIKKGKSILMSAHSGDFYLKFQTANNANFYKALMWHVFGNEAMSDATKEALNNETHQVFNGAQKIKMSTRVSNWAKKIKDLMGTNKYDFLPKHIEGNDTLKNAEKTAVEKFNQVACTPDNLLYNALKQKFNSNKWMKIWGTVGAIVLSSTVATQFLFGKKDPTVKEMK